MELHVKMMEKSWVSGFINENGMTGRFEVKVTGNQKYEGCNGRPVIKLWARLGNEVVSYDRGWDMEPETELGMRIVEAVVSLAENYSKKFC